tara:strand:+ start:302 stop:1426 length:1125 start_codon:yes stop_codon:yes gene_type:complete
MLSAQRQDQINYLNIALMFISMIAAFVMPFEVFLFAYAFLGPLHYLTEISWLHDRKYFSTGKYDFVILLGVGCLLGYSDIAHTYEFHSSFTEMFFELNLGDKLILLAFISSLLFVLVKNIFIKAVLIIVLFGFIDGWFAPNYTNAMGNEVFKPNYTTFALTSLLPTLFHVYLFTGLFMLFGALKSRSKTGLLSVLCFVLVPFLLIYVLPNTTFFQISEYGKDSYFADGKGFYNLNFQILREFNLADMPTVAGYTDIFDRPYVDPKKSLAVIFYSTPGILLMRFIAFAYLYHYLNWFSKTEVIRWHKVPKVRFIAVIVIWISACVVYLIDYGLGLTFLFFLSFTHVLLEFPLNMMSIVGIGKESLAIMKGGFSQN